MRKGTKITIKPISQLLKEGWEPIVWGWIKYRTHNIMKAHIEVSYYHGIEKILGKSRILTVAGDDGGKEIGCLETPYHVAREAISEDLACGEFEAKVRQPIDYEDKELGLVYDGAEK